MSTNYNSNEMSPQDRATLMHHKYIDKYMVNGKWVYVYEKASAKNSMNNVGKTLGRTGKSTAPASSFSKIDTWKTKKTMKKAGKTSVGRSVAAAPETPEFDIKKEAKKAKKKAKKSMKKAKKSINKFLKKHGLK